MLKKVISQKRVKANSRNKNLSTKKGNKKKHPELQYAGKQHLDHFYPGEDSPINIPKDSLNENEPLTSKRRDEIQNSIHTVLREHAKLRCTSCGYSIKEFQKSGIIKCKDCYSSFEILLLPVLEHFHGYNSYHRSKPGDL